MKTLQKFLLALLLACSLGPALATVESATYISDLNASYPAAGDAKSEGDDHIRLLKSTAKATFPNVTGAVTATHTELNYLSGVTGLLQTQINAKAPIASPTFTGTVVLPSTTSIGNVSATELGYLDGVTSAIQTQINAISASSNASVLYLSTVTASNSATLDIETTFDATYDAYMLVCSGLTPGTTNVGLSMRLKVGGAYASTSYTYHMNQSVSSASTYSANASTSDTKIELFAAGMTTGSGDHANFVAFIHNPSSTSLSKIVQVQGSYAAAGAVRMFSGVASNTSTSALTGVRIYATTGNVAAGKCRLSGIRNS